MGTNYKKSTMVPIAGIIMREKVGYLQPLFLVNTTKYYKKIVQEPPYVHFYSFEVNTDGAKISSVLPDGCADMLFIFSNKSASGRLYGFVTRRDKFVFSQGETCFGVRFYPGYIPKRFDASLAQIANRHIDIADTPGGAALIEQLAKTDAFEERAKLLTRFTGGDFRTYTLLQQLIALIELYGGDIHVSELCKKTLYSERYINRVFNNNLGMSPKSFARCVRFQKIIKTLNGSNRVELAELAANAGYCDQPHFSKDFRELAAMTPREYITAVDAKRYSEKIVYV